MSAGDRPCPVESDITTPEVVVRHRIRAILREGSGNASGNRAGGLPWSWRH